MNVLETIADRPEVAAFGWALLHFLWQGTVIAMLLAIGLSVLRGAAANVRYLACCIGMAAMVVTPLATFLYLLATGTDPVGGLVEATNRGPAAFASLRDRVAPALPALIGTWMIGAVLLQTRLVLQWMRARHLRTHDVSEIPANWQRTAQSLCAAMGIHVPVHILESTRASVPMVIGWLQPVILIPSAALLSMDYGQLRAILAHELAHVRRHDFLLNLLQALMECLLFYHPAVWWMSDRMRIEREYCCDDIAVSACGNAMELARALASLDSLSHDWPTPAVASTGGSLMNRICRLVGVRPKTTRRVSGPMLLAASATMTMTALTFTMTLSADVVEVDRNPSEVAYLEVLPERVVDIEEADLVHAMRALKLDEAELMAELREAGVDNRMLLEMLPWFGVEPKVIESLERTAVVPQSVEGEFLIRELRGEEEEPGHLKAFLVGVHEHLGGVLHRIERVEEPHQERLMLHRERNAVAHLHRAVEHFDAEIARLHDHVDRLHEHAEEGDDQAAEDLRSALAKMKKIAAHRGKAAELARRVDEMKERGATEDDLHEVIMGAARRLHGRTAKVRTSREMMDRQMHDLKLKVAELQQHRQRLLEQFEAGELNEVEIDPQLERLELALTKLKRTHEAQRAEADVLLIERARERPSDRERIDLELALVAERARDRERALVAELRLKHDQLAELELVLEKKHRAEREAALAVEPEREAEPSDQK